MLILNIYGKSSESKFIDLNTSNVDIKLAWKYCPAILLMYLNTSNVDIKQEM